MDCGKTCCNWNSSILSPGIVGLPVIKYLNHTLSYWQKKHRLPGSGKRRFLLKFRRLSECL